MLITDPELIKEVLTKNYIYQKPPIDEIGKLISQGVAAYDTDKWAKHRRLVNPTLNLEKLKVISTFLNLDSTSTSNSEFYAILYCNLKDLLNHQPYGFAILVKFLIRKLETLAVYYEMLSLFKAYLLLFLLHKAYAASI